MTATVTERPTIFLNYSPDTSVRGSKVTGRLRVPNSKEGVTPILTISFFKVSTRVLRLLKVTHT